MCDIVNLVSENRTCLIMQNNSSKILIVDDNDDVLIAARLLLNIYFSNSRKNPHSFRISEPGILWVIFLDMNFSKDTTGGEEGFFCWKKYEYDPHNCILITAYGDVEKVKAIKKGDWLITKPCRMRSFWQHFLCYETTGFAFEIEKLRQQQSFKNTTINIPESGRYISCNSKSIFYHKKSCRYYANIWYWGNGTGKELVAHAVHISPKEGWSFVNSGPWFNQPVFGKRYSAM